MINLDEILSSPSLTEGRTYKQVLQRAYAYVEPHDQWTQGTFARDDCGVSVKPRDPRAMCWCLMGAIACSSNAYGLIPPAIIKYLTSMKDYLYPDRFDSVGSMNDYLDHASVLAFLKVCVDNIPD